MDFGIPSLKVVPTVPTNFPRAEIRAIKFGTPEYRTLVHFTFGSGVPFALPGHA